MVKAQYLFGLQEMEVEKMIIAIVMVIPTQSILCP